eukprot:1000239-Amphidinium_carterae.1
MASSSSDCAESGSSATCAEHSTKRQKTGGAIWEQFQDFLISCEGEQISSETVGETAAVQIHPSTLPSCGQGPTAWLTRLTSFFDPVFKSLGTQVKPVTMIHACAGTGSAHLALKVVQSFASYLPMETERKRARERKREQEGEGDEWQLWVEGSQIGQCLCPRMIEKVLAAQSEHRREIKSFALPIFTASKESRGSKIGGFNRALRHGSEARKQNIYHAELRSTPSLLYDWGLLGRSHLSQLCRLC